jgi:hypothetical protein
MPGVYSFGASVDNTSVNGNKQEQQQGTVTKVFDPNAKNALDASLTNDQYSKGAATTDAQAAMQQSIHQALLQGAPAIDVNTRQAGGYNATSTQLLGDDLTARAAAAGSQTLLNTILGYSQANSANINAATGAVNVTTSQKSTQDTNQQSSSQTKESKASAGTVICTQLYRDGHLSRHYYLADTRFAALYFSETTRRGYHFWAVPLVRAMRKNPHLYRVVKYFGVKWSEHCAAAFQPELPLNLVGILMHLTLVPICFLLGSFVKDIDYQLLWTPHSTSVKE